MRNSDSPSCVTQACQKLLTDGAGQLEVARISKVVYAGSTFTPDSWAVLSRDGSFELVYLRSLLQVSHPISGDPTAYFEAFRFSFNQLQVKSEANTFRVDPARFQTVVDAAPATVTTEFAPKQCTIRGRWLWLCKDFRQWAQSGVCRSVHLSNTSSTELIFVHR